MTARAPGWAGSIRVGVVAATIALAAAAAAAPPERPVGPTSAAALAPRPPRRVLPHDPFPEISRDRLFATLEELTAIGRGSLFRTSASGGEAEAFDLVVRRLGELGFLAGSGMTIERQPFRTYLGGDVWEARLFLASTGGGGETEVPAHALQPHRDDLVRALRLDSDGVLNDTEPDPVEVQGPPVVVRTTAALAGLTQAAVQGRVVVLDYALVDRALLGTTEAVTRANVLLATQPAGIVLVTTFSNAPGVSHGSFVGDLGAFTLARDVAPRPTLYARLEDMASAGITTWDDLARLQAVRLRWDADVTSPGSSQNLVVRIPGADPVRAVILGAHLDSPNSPGALDNGSGSVTLLEVARALDGARVRPPTDLVLAWFGSHERGIFGSANFLATHQALLDRSLAMLQTDCLSRPIDGILANLTLEAWSTVAFGDPRLPWPAYLRQAASLRGVWPDPYDLIGISSDNSNFVAYDVPNANLIYVDPTDPTEVHYGGHLHDPYDDVPLARDVAPVLEDMARVALTAALATGHDAPVLRVTPPATRRAVFVGSHTEAPHMGPPALVELGMALALEGIDVDTVPYGTPVTASDLEGAAVVVALPVHDYPSPEGDVSPYEEAWTAAEVDVLDAYVRGGGLLVLTNSAHRLKYMAQQYEANEDTLSANVLAGRFGVSWLNGTVAAGVAVTQGTSALVAGVSTLALAPGNGVLFSAPGGQLLARAGAQPVVSLVRPASGGEVLVLADLGMLMTSTEISPANFRFWQNLAAYARTR
jgi:hypothetical protein